ncbi:MAG: GNAT family N-acetyltransferase [Solirubrobacteraceae bacterium]
MSAGRAAIERFDPVRHDVSSFVCGNESLDRWLARYAGQSQRRDAARTFVICDAGAVVGYHTLLAGELDHHDATEQARRGMSRHYPIPVAILARLAVDRRHQRLGVGAALLRDALGRVAVASEQLAVRAVVVHAIDERAAMFYGHFGFRALSATPRTLMITLAELRAAGYS